MEMGLAPGDVALAASQLSFPMGSSPSGSYSPRRSGSARLDRAGRTTMATWIARHRSQPQRPRQLDQTPRNAPMRKPQASLAFAALAAFSSRARSPAPLHDGGGVSGQEAASPRRRSAPSLTLRTAATKGPPVRPPKELAGGSRRWPRGSIKLRAAADLRGIRAKLTEF